MDYKEIVKKLCAYPKGILAADEKTSTIGKRFANINVENNAENRMEYRSLLFETEDLEKYLSGVITFDETFESTYEDGTPLIDNLLKRGILVGIKLDLGLEEFGDNEKVCVLSEDLAKRAAYYASKGATFAKWRATFNILESTPSDECIQKNAEILANYAKICLENGLVPIVEPEVLGEGNYDILTAQKVVKKVMKVVFEALESKGVNIEEIVLKPSFVRPGFDRVYSYYEVANSTLETFKGCLPSNLGGIAFLSGGMLPDEALTTLVQLNKEQKDSDFKVPCSYSFGRAIQAQVLEVWSGKKENVKPAQAKLLEVLRRFK